MVDNVEFYMTEFLKLIVIELKEVEGLFRLNNKIFQIFT